MKITRRELLTRTIVIVLGTGISFKSTRGVEEEKNLVMCIIPDKCIGCGMCVKACKIENKIPVEKPISRTWIEGYEIKIKIPYSESDVKKIVMNTSKNPFLTYKWGDGEHFFVPKLCNQCQKAPCVRVCPVNARFYTAEGIVLVDKNSCIGCKYCVTACPYGATYLHPDQKVTDKCTYCYHRIKRGFSPACVQACPTGARVFGDINNPSSEVSKILREGSVDVLLPEEGTDPKTFYIGLENKFIVEHSIATGEEINE